MPLPDVTPECASDWRQAGNVLELYDFDLQATGKGEEFMSSCCNDGVQSSVMHAVSGMIHDMCQSGANVVGSALCGHVLCMHRSETPVTLQ